MAGAENTARVGLLTVDDEIKTRRTLAEVLRHSETVVKGGYIVEIRRRDLLHGDKILILRLSERCFDRHFTVAEANLVHAIRGWICDTGP